MKVIKWKHAGRRRNEMLPPSEEGFDELPRLAGRGWSINLNTVEIDWNFMIEPF